MVNINVVFDFRLKKLGDGWWAGGWWVVFTEIKDRFEPINYCSLDIDTATLASPDYNMAEVINQVVIMVKLFVMTEVFIFRAGKNVLLCISFFHLGSTE